MKIFLIIVYLIPLIIAGLRNHPNSVAISFLNILAGWTFVGWLIAFVWSLSSQKPKVVYVRSA